VHMVRACRGCQAGPAKVLGPPVLSAHGHKNRGGRHGLPGGGCQLILTAAGVEVKRGVVGEHADEVVDRFWGGGEEGAH
jgi:hypothetical protein